MLTAARSMHCQTIKPNVTNGGGNTTRIDLKGENHLYRSFCFTSVSDVSEQKDQKCNAHCIFRKDIELICCNRRYVT